MNTIRCFETYNNEMKKSMIDKIFFIDKIETDVIVDYGCADGSLVGFLKELFPNITCIGFDNDITAINLAKENHQDIKFFSKWKDVTHHLLAMKYSSATLVLSSVFHEIFHYCSEETVDRTFDNIFSSNLFKYIAIRDMSVSKSIVRKSDEVHVANIFKYANRDHLNDFQGIWGNISQNENLVHFLMKYRYIMNWDREVRENYFPVHYEEFFQLIPDCWNIIYHDHFILPFIKNVVKQDFNIDLIDNTHLKLILELTNT